jgi:phosphoribosylanthranilate isomerase
MVHVKICGITSLLDARAACDAGANSLGFNFYEKSPRQVAASDAARIRAQLPANVEAVGVFVNAQPPDIIGLAASVRLHAAQLHGDEPPQIVTSLSRSLRIIKAFSVELEFPLASLDKYAAAFAFLFDAPHTGQYGGTGHSTDWDVARRAAQSRRIILAGGLKVGNVAAAVRIVRPYGVDVASGVESKPGKKDHGLLREFIQEVRRAEKQLDEQPENSSKS